MLRRKVNKQMEVLEWELREDAYVTGIDSAT